MAAARCGRRREVVLVLLLFSVLAPIVLYTDTTISPFSDSALAKRAFDRDASSLIARNEVGEKLNAVTQDSFDVVKEPARIAFAADVSLPTDLTIGGSGEHKNRVLSATNEGRVVRVKRDSHESDISESKNEVVIANNNEGSRTAQAGIIEQVVSQESDSGGSDDAGENKEAALQNGEDTEEMGSWNLAEVERRNEAVLAAHGGSQSGKEGDVGDDGLSEMRENNNDGVHNAGDPNVSSEEGNSEERSSGQNTLATPGEPKTKSSTSNAGDSATSPDATVHLIKDQLIRAKMYLGFLASRGNHGFIKELRARMRDIQRALGDAVSDKQLPKNVHEKVRAMERTLVKVKKVHDNCSALINRLRAALHSTEQQLQAHKKEANYLAQVAAKTLSKGLHCLPLRLTNEYYTVNSKERHFPYEEKLEDPKLYHYALFSDNVLAAAVVVNSTLVHAKKPEKHVFHIVTDKLNYAAMKMWFLANPLGRAVVQVQTIEEFTWLNSSYSPVLKQLESQSMIDYYFRTHQAKRDENPKFRNPKYLSILNHLRFYLPEIFPKLNKVLFLDDDIVVQQDLTALWSIDLKGKVNGAVETCGESFHRFDKYLNFSNPLIAENFNPHACGWAYGMNIFDLAEWRKQNLTDVYHSWQKLNENRLLWKLGTLPAGLVTFWNRTFPLGRSWHLLGLGYNPNVNVKDVERAAVIHYNGNLKPWLEIGLPKYRKYWSKYVDFDRVFLRECNINP